MEILNDPRFASLKRLVAFVVAALVVLLNNKLGLGITENQQMMLVALVIGYVAQSGIKAAMTVKDTASAVEALRKGPPS